MKDRFNVVAVRVEDERSVVARMVCPLSGRTVVVPPSAQCREVEGVDHFAARRLEREMDSGDRAVGLVDPQLVGMKVPFTDDQNLTQAQTRQDGAIEAFAGLDVGDAKMDVIDEPAKMVLH
jgi:hypothetical protein